MPNLSLKGDATSPTLVVAPTKVNGGRAIVIEWIPLQQPLEAYGFHQ